MQSNPPTPFILPPDSSKKMAQLQLAFSELHRLVEEIVPQSREREICLINLETAAMWGIKSLMVSPISAVK